jgi:hypothetical protein
VFVGLIAHFCPRLLLTCSEDGRRKTESEKGKKTKAFGCERSEGKSGEATAMAMAALRREGRRLLLSPTVPNPAPAAAAARSSAISPP